MVIIDLKEVPVAPLHHLNFAHFDDKLLLNQFFDNPADGRSAEPGSFGDFDAGHGRVGKKHPQHRCAVGFELFMLLKVRRNGNVLIPPNYNDTNVSM